MKKPSEFSDGLYSKNIFQYAKSSAASAVKRCFLTDQPLQIPPVLPEPASAPNVQH